MKTTQLFKLVDGCGRALLTTHKAVTNILYFINNQISQKEYFPLNNHSVSILMIPASLHAGSVGKKT